MDEKLTYTLKCLHKNSIITLNATTKTLEKGHVECTVASINGIYEVTVVYQGINYFEQVVSLGLQLKHDHYPEFWIQVAEAYKAKAEENGDEIQRLCERYVESEKDPDYNSPVKPKDALIRSLQISNNQIALIQRAIEVLK